MPVIEACSVEEMARHRALVVSRWQRCPLCGELNDDNWPVRVGDGVEWGGCRMCWEEQCSAAWWETAEQLAPFFVRPTEAGRLCAACGCSVDAGESLCAVCEAGFLGEAL